jgi:hypothetical protein
MVFRRLDRAALGAGLAALVAVCASACSSKSPGGFSSGDDAGGEAGGDDGSSYGGSSSGSGGGSSGGLVLSDASNGGGLGTGTCKNGMYSGMFMCAFAYDPNAEGGTSIPDAGFDGGGFVITGTISFQLMQDTASGESFIDTASGMLGGNCCLDLFSLQANVGGQLNCNSGAFNGSLAQGTYTGFGMTGSFSGPVIADYDGKNSAFVNGQWDLTIPGQGTCVGIWTANYTGP